MSEINKLIGARIRDIRKSKGISQEKLAEVAETHFSFIGAIERGERNPTLKTLEKIAECLNVDVYDFFTYAQELNNKSQQVTVLNEIIALLKTFDIKQLQIARNILKELKRTHNE